MNRTGLFLFIAVVILAVAAYWYYSTQMKKPAEPGTDATMTEQPTDGTMPAEGTEAAPAEGTETMPAEGTEAPPAEGTEAAPAEGTEAPAEPAPAEEAPAEGTPQ